MICAHCSTPLPDGSRFCIACGADLSDPRGGPRTEGSIDLQKRVSAALEGRYRVRQMLGRGGMGAVYLADDLALEREVAIKVLPIELSVEENFVQRFVHEARTAAKLDHPNIIPIYAVQSEAHLHYFVMKYIAGCSLHALLGGGPLPVATAQRILGHAALALGHAHKRGVIHRDVKPSNILIDEKGRPLLVDFGISKALESAMQFTGTGQVVGSPQYMSPEQAKGVELDGRTDQYSLALVGYQLLAGVPPFKADTPHAAMYKHIHETAAPVKTLRPEVPAQISDAIERAMSKAPDERFRTMEEFAEAVWPGCSGTPAAAERPTEIMLQAWAAARRRRVSTLAAGAVVVAIAGIVALQLRPGPSREVDERAVVPPAVTPESALAPPSEPATVALPEPRSAAARRETAAARGREGGQPAAGVGWITIDAVPYGTISVNGVDIGDTPMRHTLRPGTYTVRVSREGYRTWSETITVTAGNTERRRVQLVPEQP